MLLPLLLMNSPPVLVLAMAARMLMSLSLLVLW
jgi:hypothetical protein